MCYSAKASLIAWWLLAILSLFLWYRAEAYDRAIAVFVLTLGLIQLIEYAVHSGVSSSQTGKAIFLTLWLQVLVLAIGTYIFLKTALSGALVVLFAVIFVAALIFVFGKGGKLSATVGSSGHVEWSRDGSSMLGNWSFLYLFGLFFPLVLILAHYHWANYGLLILITYGLISLAYVVYHYKPLEIGSMWCYLAVGFAMLAWFVGIFP